MSKSVLYALYSVKTRTISRFARRKKMSYTLDIVSKSVLYIQLVAIFNPGVSASTFEEQSPDSLKTVGVRDRARANTWSNSFLCTLYGGLKVAAGT